MPTSKKSAPKKGVTELETKGFKGFNKDLKCKDFQYKEGETFELPKDKKLVCCDINNSDKEGGLHFCLNPLDIFAYYPPGTSKYHAVTGHGEVKAHSSDSKMACSKISIGGEISLKSIIEGGIKFIFEKVKWTKENTTTGDNTGATSNGDNSGATSNGYRSGATSNGNRSGATSNGDNSGATSNGNRSGATSNGDNSGATSNGDNSGATSNGYSSGATSNGDNSGATSNGYRSGATSNGNRSGATSNGYSSGATSNGDNSGATSNGYSSGATSNGDNSGATSNGNRSGATSNGDNCRASTVKGGVATVIGKNGRCKGAIGAWLVITEGDYDSNRDFYIKDLKSVLVDGEIIKANTFYS